MLDELGRYRSGRGIRFRVCRDSVPNGLWEKVDALWKNGDNENDERERRKKDYEEDANAISSGNSENGGALKPESNTTGPPQHYPLACECDLVSVLS